LDEKSKRSRAFEIAGVRAAENGDLPYAIQCFTNAISEASHRASGYNNRAQAYRLQGNINGKQRNI